MIDILFFSTILGCYRFNDGETMRDVFENSFNSDCTTNCALTFKTTGPVDVQNSQCSLLWKNSTFMGDDPQWLPVSGENEGFSLAYDQQYGGVELKVRVNVLACINEMLHVSRASVLVRGDGGGGGQIKYCTSAF